MRATISVAVVAIAAAVAPASASAVRYASPGGAASGDCATAATACTLEGAVEGNVTGPPAAGEEVILLPGAYTLSAELIPAAAAMHIHGAAGQPRPVINATSRISLSDSTLSDVEISTAGTGEAINSSLGTVERVYIHGSANGASPLCQCYGGTFRNSVVLTSGPAPAVGASSNGGSFSMTYRNVTALSTNPTTPALSVNQILTQALDLQAINVIALNVAGGPDVAVHGPASRITFSNSNYRDVDLTNGGVVNNFSGVHQTALPLFTDAANGDFSPLASSPTVNAGLNDPLNGTLDVAGNPRSVGAATDIGGNEYQPPIPPGSKPGATKCKKKKRKKKSAGAAAKKKKKKGCKKKRKKKRR